MTISNNYAPIRQPGNGATTQFSANWKVVAAAYIRVYLEDAVTGVQTALTQGPGAAQFQLVINTNGGPTVTYNTAPPVGKYAVVGRDVALDQTDPYKTSKGYQGTTLEQSLDKLTAITQDLSEKSSRSLKFPLGSTAVGVLPAPVDDLILAWDGTTGKIKNGPSISSIATNTAAAAASAAAALASQIAAAASASSASASQIAAAASASSASASASTATTQAGIATTQATTATTQAGNASTSATTATTQAGIATTQAGISTTQASNSSASAAAALASQNAASTSAGNAATSETNAAASAVASANSAAQFQGTSATSITIGTGTKVFTTQTGKIFNGQNVRVYSNANNTNYMDGLATYSGTSCSVAVASTSGSGTFTDWIIKVNGDRGAVGPTGPTGSIPITTAAGTADAITADYTPDVTLTNLTLVAFVASAANTTTTPTFAPDGLTARTITKKGGSPLVPGDIPGALAVCFLEYNSANTRWELLNPATSQLPWVIAGGTADAITATYVPSLGTLYDGQQVIFRASAANATTTPTFAPNGGTARTIVKKGGSALVAGDIPGNLAEVQLSYNLANTRWELLNPASVPSAGLSVIYNSIAGFLPSSITGTNTTASATFSAGQAADSTNASMIAKVTTTSWAVSNGNAINGYQGGTTLPNSSTIHFFACTGSSGTGIFAHNTTTPTLPSGYNTSYRRVASLRTSATGALIPGTFIETEGGAALFWYTTQILDINTLALASTGNTITLTVPAGIKVEPKIRLRAGNVSGTISAGAVIVLSGDETNTAPQSSSNAYTNSSGTVGFTATPGWDFAAQSGGTISSFTQGFSDNMLTTNTSGQIIARDQSSTVILFGVTRGFKDYRRS